MIVLLTDEGASKWAFLVLRGAEETSAGEYEGQHTETQQHTHTVLHTFGVLHLDECRWVRRITGINQSLPTLAFNFLRLENVPPSQNRRNGVIELLQGEHFKNCKSHL